MRIASLGSGSKGNATLVDTGETLLLIDCGLPARKPKTTGLAGVAAADLDAILVTHEHGDHCRGVVPLAKAHSLPVFLTAGTASSRKLEGLRHSVVIRPVITSPLAIARLPPNQCPMTPASLCNFALRPVTASWAS